MLRCSGSPVMDRLADRLTTALNADGEAEGGSAVVEFVLMGLLLLVPVIYLVITAGQLQGGAYAVVGAADQAARVYADAETPAEGQARAHLAAVVAMEDFGFDADSMDMSISCSEACLTPGSLVTVNVEVPVPLPLVPGNGAYTSVGVVHSSSTQMVERFG